VLLHLRQLHGLDHLADGGVGTEEDGVTVLLCRIKGYVSQIGVFLHAGRSQNDGAVIAVAAAAGQLPVVALALGDIAQTGADAHDVDDHRRDIVGHQVGDALLIQGEARSGGAGQRPCAGRGRAQQHVDSRKL